MEAVFCVLIPLVTIPVLNQWKTKPCKLQFYPAQVLSYKDAESGENTITINIYTSGCKFHNHPPSILLVAAKYKHFNHVHISYSSFHQANKFLKQKLLITVKNGKMTHLDNKQIKGFT